MHGYQCGRHNPTSRDSDHRVNPLGKGPLGNSAGDVGKQNRSHGLARDHAATSLVTYDATPFPQSSISDFERVNLILFEPSEVQQPLALTDRRARHVLTVLRRQVGDTFDVGVVNGSRGKATLKSVTSDVLVLGFQWTEAPRIADPITLIVGLPRPQTARDILRDATTLGVAAIHFVRTHRSDPSYAQSTLWTTGEWRRHLISGAEQAFDTAIPEVTFTETLGQKLSSLASSSVRVALDNYESPTRLSETDVMVGPHLILAIGGERGWSGQDRDVLRSHGFTFCHLGNRILRTETAVIAALTLLRARLGLL